MTLRVLVTGAAGTIGRAVLEHLGGRYDLVAMSHRPADVPSIVADITDLEAIAPHFGGIDAVVHLAASPLVQTPWEDIRDNNLIGTYNVYEAARRAGVGLVVFASSNHTIGMYEEDGLPDLYRLDDPRVYDHAVDVRPDSLYGVSKVYGEALGRYYHERFGLRVHNLRIGTVRADDDPRAAAVAIASEWLGLTPEQAYARVRATWMSRRDCAELIAACLEAREVGWATVYGVSANPRRFWDIEHARELLGWSPQDSAPRGDEP